MTVTSFVSKSREFHRLHLDRVPYYLPLSLLKLSSSGDEWTSFRYVKLFLKVEIELFIYGMIKSVNFFM